MTDKPQVVYTVDNIAFSHLLHLKRHKRADMNMGMALYLQAVAPTIMPEVRMRVTELPFQGLCPEATVELLQPFKVEYRTPMVPFTGGKLTAYPSINIPLKDKNIRSEPGRVAHITGTMWSVDEVDCREQVLKLVGNKTDMVHQLTATSLAEGWNA